MHSAPAAAAPCSAGSANSCQAKISLASRVAEVELDLPLLEQDVHRHDDAAGAQNAVVGERELGHVRKHDPDSVAGLDAVLAQQARDASGRLVELGVGDHEFVDPQRGTVWIPLRGCGQVIGEVLVHRRSFFSGVGVRGASLSRPAENMGAGA